MMLSCNAVLRYGFRHAIQGQGQPPRGTPSNIRMCLIFLETRIMDLHFALIVWSNFIQIFLVGSVLEMGRCRYFRSISVFGIFSVFVKYGVGILKYRGIGIMILPGPLLFSRPVSACSLSFPGFQTVGNACSTRLFV